MPYARPALLQRLGREAQALVAAGAELIALCTNRMHKVAEAITAAVDVPFIHIADATADAVHEQELRTVGLLATAYTMEQDLYVGRLQKVHGLEVLVPGDEDRTHAGSSPHCAFFGAPVDLGVKFIAAG